MGIQVSDPFLSFPFYNIILKKSLSPININKLHFPLLTICFPIRFVYCPPLFNSLNPQTNTRHTPYLIKLIDTIRVRFAIIMDCPPTNKDVENRIKVRIATRIEKHRRDADIYVLREELDRVLKRRKEERSSLTGLEKETELAESRLTTLEEQKKAAKSSLTELEEEKKLILASTMEYTGRSGQDLIASLQYTFSRSEVTPHLNIGPHADGLDYSGGSGDQVLGAPRRLTAPTAADASRGTEPLQSGPGVGGSRDTNRWHLREDMARIQSSDVLPDEFIFVLRGSPSTEQYVLRCPEKCGHSQRPWVVNGIFMKPFIRARAFNHFLRYHSNKFPLDLEANDAQRFIVTHFAKKVEWNTDRSQRRNKCEESTLCDLDYTPKGDALQKFQEWKISRRALGQGSRKTRNIENQSGVDQEANMDSQRGRLSPSVTSSPASPFDPEYAEEAEYLPPTRMSRRS